MKYAYYPGCSLHSTASDYQQSIDAVFEKLGIELEEIEGWTCCGASAAHVTEDLLFIIEKYCAIPPSPPDTSSPAAPD